MNVWAPVLISTLAISSISLIGLLTLYLSRKQIEMCILPVVGFAAGALLGNVFFHLLPELVKREGALDTLSSTLVILGIVTFFLLEQGVRYWQTGNASAGHHHFPAEEAGEAHAGKGGVQDLLQAKPFAVVSLGGKLLHHFIDGMVVGGSYLIDMRLGVATTVAVMLHEIPSTLGDFAVLMQAGLSRLRAVLFSFLVALPVIVGGTVTLLFGQKSDMLPLYLIPFTAGSFTYLALGDLIPELHADSMRRGKMLSGAVGLFIGIVMMELMEMFAH
ncbi:MAG TPA: ZIP family metal transporter [Armatimonadota bacterium]|nr:ZIP family metal transporter [Armatimonadota bacterium]